MWDAEVGTVILRYVRSRLQYVNILIDTITVEGGTDEPFHYTKQKYNKAQDSHSLLSR
jgi:hypothetical protein